MKTTKLLVLLTVITFLSTSCSKKEEPFDFTGTWNLTSLNIGNAVVNDPYSSLNSEVQIDEDCLANSYLIVFPDNTASFKFTSTVESSVQVIDGTTDQLEQVITCENEEQEINLVWTTEPYLIENEDGSTYLSGNIDGDSIAFLDENGKRVMLGLKFIDNGLMISSDDFSTIQVNSEELEIYSSQLMNFTR